MKKTIFESITAQLAFLSLAVFFSCLPFLSAGYGVEEDSWLLVITAKNIFESGAYEMSRAPAHPLQEIIYSLMWNAGPFAYNLLSAVMSVIAIVFFALSLRQLGFKHYLFASFAFTFTPVVFISSTYTIDYMWAMAFVMGSFYFLLLGISNPDQRNKWLRFLTAGIFLGLAIGFRITSGAMLISFCILLFPVSKNLKGILILLFTAALIGFITYLPVFKTYGISFITTYFEMADRFPSPSLAKIFYKATIGVFGLIGILALLFFLVKIFIDRALLKTKKSGANKSEKAELPRGQSGFEDAVQRSAHKLYADQRRNSKFLEVPDRNKKQLYETLKKKILFACALTSLLYLFLYIRVPHKSAFLIPIIPFVILFFGYLLSSRSFKIFCLLLTLSSFLFSMNLTDSFRGAKYSPLAVKFTAAGQEIFFDPLTGPVFSDYTKRLNKITFTKTILEKTKPERNKIVLICGWWYNELMVEQWGQEKNQNVEFVFYIDKETMKKYISAGYEIYYLPEQNIYNDLYSKTKSTDSVAKPYIFQR